MDCILVVVPMVVGYSTLGSGQVAANIVLGAGNILGQFTGIATGGGTPAIGIGNSVLVNYTGLIDSTLR